MILYACATVGGILATWFSLDAVVRWLMGRRWFLGATDFSFFIFGLHIPLLAFVTHLFFIYLHDFRWYRLLTYLRLDSCSSFLYWCSSSGKKIISCSIQSDHRRTWVLNNLIARTTEAHEYVVVGWVEEC